MISESTRGNHRAVSRANGSNHPATGTARAAFDRKDALPRSVDGYFAGIDCRGVDPDRCNGLRSRNRRLNIKCGTGSHPVPRQTAAARSSGSCSKTASSSHCNSSTFVAASHSPAGSSGWPAKPHGQSHQPRRMRLPVATDLPHSPPADPLPAGKPTGRSVKPRRTLRPVAFFGLPIHENFNSLSRFQSAAFATLLRIARQGC